MQNYGHISVHRVGLWIVERITGQLEVHQGILYITHECTLALFLYTEREVPKRGRHVSNGMLNTLESRDIFHEKVLAKRNFTLASAANGILSISDFDKLKTTVL